MKKILIIITALLLLTLAGCGGGSGSSATDESVNLKVTSIEQPAGDANAGHGIDLQYTLESDGIASDVVVNFYIVNDSQFSAQDNDASTPQSEQFYLGNDKIDTVLDGDNVQVASFIIPEGVSTEGEYFIIAHVDPDDMVFETEEEDNIFSTSSEAASSVAASRASNILLDISTDYVDVTNFIIEDVVLEETSVIIDGADLTAAAPSLTDLSVEYPAHGSAHLSGYAVLKVEGKVPTVAELQAVKVKAQININDVWTDIYTWNYDLGRYGDYVTLQVLEEELSTLEDDEELDKGFEEYTVNIDLNIPAAAALAMMNEIVAESNASLLSNYNKFDVRIIVDSDDAVAELSEDDNAYSVPVTVYSFPNAVRASSDYLMEKSYDKGIGSKSKVKVELDMYAKNGLETGPKYGAIMKNSVELKGYAFKHSANIFAISDQHSAYVNSLGDTGYKQEIELFGNILYGEEQWADSITISYEKSWNKEDILASADFYIGPVPLTAEAGAEGSFAIMLSATLSAVDNTPILSTDNNLPDVDFDLYVSAGVGNSLFSAGPIVTLVILDELLNVYGYATVDYDEGLDQLDTGSIGMKITNDIESIKGKFGLYVKYRTVKWCKKWGVPYPCGTKKKKKTKYYYKTKALYDKKITLYENDKNWTF